MKRIELLVKEYELCQQKALAQESPIWQTNAAIGVVSIGALIALILNAVDVKANSTPMDWEIALAVGSGVITCSWIWFIMARRWWDVQQTMLRRMTQIAAAIKQCDADYKDLFMAEHYINFRNHRMTLKKNKRAYAKYWRYYIPKKPKEEEEFADEHFRLKSTSRIKARKRFLSSHSISKSKSHSDSNDLSK